MQGLDILSVLLQKTHQKVDRKCDVLPQLFFTHLHVPHSNPHAQHFFQLKLHTRFRLVYFFLQTFRVCHYHRELIVFCQHWTQYFWVLFDAAVSGHYNTVCLEELFDWFPLLIELFTPICIDIVEYSGLRGVTVHLVPQNAHFQVWSRNVRQSDRTCKTFVFVRVVIFQSDLQLHSLTEFPSLFLRNHCVNVFFELFLLKFAHFFLFKVIETSKYLT